MTGGVLSNDATNPRGTGEVDALNGGMVNQRFDNGSSVGAELVTTLTTPSGNPALRNAWPIRQCTRGQSSEALSTTVLPQARGMAIAQTPKITGAFQGAMPSTTPAGWRIASARRPGLSD